MSHTMLLFKCEQSKKGLVKTENTMIVGILLQQCYLMKNHNSFNWIRKAILPNYINDMAL